VEQGQIDISPMVGICIKREQQMDKVEAPISIKIRNRSYWKKKNLLDKLIAEIKIGKKYNFFFFGIFL
jgi:hypothetical protein